MDDLVEIPPPPTIFKRKEVKLCNVIEIDDDEDCVGLGFFNEVADSKSKGKAKVYDTHDYNNMMIEENGVASSKSLMPVTPNVINLDDHSSDVSFDDYEDEEDYMNSVSEDLMDLNDMAILQSHFDSSNIPAGVEASIPFLLNPLESEQNLVLGSNKKPVSGNDSVDGNGPVQSDITGRRIRKTIPGSEFSHMKSSSSSSNHSDFHAPVDWGSRKKGFNLHLGAPISTPLSKSGTKRQSKKKQVSMANPEYDSMHHSKSSKVPYASDPAYWEYYNPGTIKPDAPVGLGLSNYHAFLQQHPGMIPPHSNSNLEAPFFNFISKYGVANPYSSSNYPSQGSDFVVAENSHKGSSVSGPRNTAHGDKAEVLRKYHSFKQFESVEGHSDHHYANQGSPSKQPPKNWAKRIQEEWKSLKKDLPDTIYVRVYESRMDIMRAVIVGAEGTPYHDGLFFFDVFFPSTYPNVPPSVHYHAGGLRLNPNLYDTGYVCLSLLNTWSGGKDELWIPGKSTMLQVLVSIQGLILNAKPFFNEPGYARLSGSPHGLKKSSAYNEDVFILSLKTMSYSIRRPPTHFEDFVIGHFLEHGREILVACKAYLEGAQVGCLVKGGVQDVDEYDKSCSESFKHSLKNFLTILVADFTVIGVDGCDQFLRVQ